MSFFIQTESPVVAAFDYVLMGSRVSGGGAGSFGVGSFVGMGVFAGDPSEATLDRLDAWMARKSGVTL